MTARPGSARNGGIQRLAVRGLLGHIHIADSFAGEGQGLGIGIADDSVPVNFRQERHLDPIGQLPVRLVGDDVNGVAVLRGLFVEDCRQLLVGFPGVDDAGGVIGGVEDDRLRAGRDHLLHSGQVDLEGGDVRRDDPEFQPRFLGEGLVLRKIGRDSQNFRPRDCQRPEHAHQLRRRAAADEEFLRNGGHAVAAVQVVGNGLPGGVIAYGGGVAVNQQGIGVVEDLAHRLVHLLRRGDGGVAQGIVVDVLPSHNGGALAAVFKQVPDAGAVGTQSIGGWIQHIVTSCGEIILRFDTKSEYGSAQTIPRQWSGESTGS